VGGEPPARLAGEPRAQALDALGRDRAPHVGLAPGPGERRGEQRRRLQRLVGEPAGEGQGPGRRQRDVRVQRGGVVRDAVAPAERERLPVEVGGLGRPVLGDERAPARPGVDQALLGEAGEHALDGHRRRPVAGDEVAHAGQARARRPRGDRRPQLALDAAGSVTLAHESSE
jgi:hypothetical protein